MLQIESGELLEEFRAIKLPKDVRAFVDNARDMLQECGDLPLGIKSELRAIAKRYGRQLRMLRESREKARRTVSMKKLGISQRRANELAENRRRAVEAQKNDLGF